jgi:hypothetical protein
MGGRRDTVRSEMGMPSLSNSPWLRGAPQSGFAAAIFRIRVRIAGLTSGRPLFRLEIRLQNRRKPRRCQATTVSGLTMINARCQSFQVLGHQRTQVFPKDPARAGPSDVEKAETTGTCRVASLALPVLLVRVRG